jgi:hypothetical protein
MRMERFSSGSGGFDNLTVPQSTQSSRSEYCTFWTLVCKNVVNAVLQLAKSFCTCREYMTSCDIFCF